MDVFLPEDLEAERFAIGCVLLADGLNAKRAFRELWDVHFSDDYHGWIWGRLSWACKKVAWDEGVVDWLVKDGARERSRKYGGTLVYDLFRFTRPALYWNLHWYTSRVRGAYKRRASIIEARIHLGTLLTEAHQASYRGFSV